MIKDTVVMLSERPNVRVHNDPLRMCPARESRLYVGTRNARGAFSLVRFFGASKEMNKQFLKFFGFRPSPELRVLI